MRAPSRSHPAWLAAAMVVATTACDAPAPPPSTGGTTIPAGPCGRGLVVVSSDYQSTNVSLFDWAGAELSSSVVSSGSSAPGLSTALTGDVVAPTALQTGARFTLLDRFPASVLTWVDVESGEVSQQLSVQTGFSANPQDYLEIFADKAYVSRYEPNPSPGEAPYDEGSDILIVDPLAPAITGRIDLDFAVEGLGADHAPRPSRMLLAGDRAYVLLSPYSLDFVESGDATVAAIDTATDAVVASLRLTGLRGCRGLALSPSGGSLAVGCSGSFEGTSSPSLDDAGVVVVDLVPAGEPSMVERLRVPGERFGAPPTFSLDFAAEEGLLVATFGELAGDGATLAEDRLWHVALASEALAPLDAASPFAMGEVRCGVACGRCFVANADRGGIVAVDLTATPAVAGASPVAPELGLPPRYLGGF